MWDFLYSPDPSPQKKGNPKNGGLEDDVPVSKEWCSCLKGRWCSCLKEVFLWLVNLFLFPPTPRTNLPDIRPNLTIGISLTKACLFNASWKCSFRFSGGKKLGEKRLTTETLTQLPRLREYIKALGFGWLTLFPVKVDPSLCVMVSCSFLGGGNFKYFWNFHPAKFGEDDFQFDEFNIFSKGLKLNHQPAVLFWGELNSSSLKRRQAVWCFWWPFQPRKCFFCLGVGDAKGWICKITIDVWEVSFSFFPVWIVWKIYMHKYIHIYIYI